MSGVTSVRGNRIVIEGRAYEAKVLGGGRFNVFNSKGAHVGMFAVRGRSVEAEDLGVEGADPVATIGQMWVTANLSPQAKSPEAVAAEQRAATVARLTNDVPAVPVRSEPIAIEAPPPRPASAEPPPAAAMAAVVGQVKPGATCRIVAHERPDAASLKKAIAYHAWLRTQEGVLAAYLTHDTANGKTVSVTVWETRDQYTAMRYAKPPDDSAPLKALTTDLLWVVG
jgi:hypothetical protein